MKLDFLDLPSRALAHPGAGKDLLDQYLALRYGGVLPAQECARLVHGVYDGRAGWIANFEESQYTLGRAWYTDLEQDREAEYFAQAAHSDQQVRRSVPGMQEGLLGMLASILGDKVVQRPGWCGPGIHIFPAGQWVAENGGEVHFDTEGLSEEQLADEVPALTLVLMLQPPQEGGGLLVWDLRYDGDDGPRDAPDPDEAACVTVPYRAGDLVIIDSYRLHQIAPFSGPRDRISATVHAVLADGRWEAWF